mmetsp:Transcript_12175/g.45176  ORF Transcript_12175/g.45176 Transcript_12175/m.45176 type:complete len:200 (-) Transcript_12175:105-704(-)
MVFGPVRAPTLDSSTVSAGTSSSMSIARPLTSNCISVAARISIAGFSHSSIRRSSSSLGSITNVWEAFEAAASPPPAAFLLFFFFAARRTSLVVMVGLRTDSSFHTMSTSITFLASAAALTILVLLNTASTGKWSCPPSRRGTSNTCARSMSSSRVWCVIGTKRSVPSRISGSCTSSCSASGTLIQPPFSRALSKLPSR